MKLLNTPEGQGKSPQELLDEPNSLDSNSNMEDYLEEVLRARDKVYEIEAQLAEANTAKRNAETALLERMLDQGLDSFKALGKSITRSEMIRASVLKDDREHQIEWLREVGAGSMVEQTVNANTFSAFIRDLIREHGDKTAEEVLPPFVKVYREPRLMVRGVVK